MYGTSSEKNLKTGWATPTHWASKRRPCQSRQERLRHNLAMNTTPSAATHSWRERKPQGSSLWSEGVKPHIGQPWLLRPILERQAPKRTSFENQQAQGHKTIAVWETCSLRACDTWLTSPKGPAWKCDRGAPRQMWERLIYLSWSTSLSYNTAEGHYLLEKSFYSLVFWSYLRRPRYCGCCLGTAASLGPDSGEGGLHR